MNAAEAAVLLAAISAHDNREVTESSARAWADALPDVDLRDALDYLPTYYRCATRETRNWVYPGDVLEGVIDLHHERRRAFGEQARQEAIAVVDMDDPNADYNGVKAAIQAHRRYNAEHRIPNPSKPNRNDGKGVALWP